MAEERVRLLRVIEYVGTRAFVDQAINGRTVKGTHLFKQGNYMGCFIREAIIGETAELLPKETEGDKTE